MQRPTKSAAAHGNDIDGQRWSIVCLAPPCQTVAAGADLFAMVGLFQKILLTHETDKSNEWDLIESRTERRFSVSRNRQRHKIFHRSKHS
jgi:hypothetical protein